MTVVLKVADTLPPEVTQIVNMVTDDTSLQICDPATNVCDPPLCDAIADPDQLRDIGYSIFEG